MSHVLCRPPKHQTVSQTRLTPCPLTCLAHAAYTCGLLQVPFSPTQWNTSQRRCLLNQTLKDGYSSFKVVLLHKKKPSVSFMPLFWYCPFRLLVSRTARCSCHLCFGIKTARVPIQSLSFTWEVNLETWTNYLTSQIASCTTEKELEPISQCHCCEE